MTASLTGMPYTASATTNAEISAAVAATHAGFRSAPSMMKSTMIGTAAASADRPSEPPRGAYVCVHMSGRNHTTIFEDLRIYDLRIYRGFKSHSQILKFPNRRFSNLVDDFL